MTRKPATTSPTAGEVLDLPLLLDGSRNSQPSRVHAALRAAILGGRLAPGFRLPSSRSLATQLGVRRNAVVVAYEHLLSDGLAEARMGSGTFVAARVPAGPAKREVVAQMPPPEPRAPFALGRTHPDPALVRGLARAALRHLARGDPGYFGYGDPRGSERLRKELARHLAAARGISCDPSQIIITGGTQQGLRLCAGVLLAPGDPVWIEDPCYPVARRILEAVGARLVPVPVDGSGFDVGEGRRREPRARLAYVTPSHQFPTGAVLRMERRVALLDWARENDAWILEDDYDSEFRYAGPPLTALAGMDHHGRVLYFGTFSKTLLAGLRIGFAVLPPRLVPEMVAARASFDRFPASPLADAVADLMADGSFAAHVRRTRSRYRAARDLVAATLVRTSGGCLRVAVPDGGLHLLATLPDGLPADAAHVIRERAGVSAWFLSETRIETRGPEAFLLGISGHAPSDLEDAATRLGVAVLDYCAAV